MSAASRRVVHQGQPLVVELLCALSSARDGGGARLGGVERAAETSTAVEAECWPGLHKEELNCDAQWKNRAIAEDEDAISDCRLKVAPDGVERGHLLRVLGDVAKEMARVLGLRRFETQWPHEDGVQRLRPAVASTISEDAKRKKSSTRGAFSALPEVRLPWRTNNTLTVLIAWGEGGVQEGAVVEDDLLDNDQRILQENVA